MMFAETVESSEIQPSQVEFVKGFLSIKEVFDSMIRYRVGSAVIFVSGKIFGRENLLWFLSFLNSSDVLLMVRL